MERREREAFLLLLFPVETSALSDVRTIATKSSAYPHHSLKEFIGKVACGACGRRHVVLPVLAKSSQAQRRAGRRPV